MTWASWLALVGTIGLVVVSPGPSVALVWAQRVQYGPQAVPLTVAGDLTANVLQLGVAWIGLVQLQTIGVAGRTAAWVGAGYLAYLGVRRMWGAARNPRHAVPAVTTSATAPGSAAFFARGFVVSAANPKAIIFFMGLLPASLAGQHADVARFVIVAGTFVTMDGGALALYAMGGGRLRACLARRDRLHWEGRIAGGLLLAASIVLAWRTGH